MTRGDRMKTVQLALTMFRDEADIQWHLLMAATLVVNIPIYAVFFLAQRQFVSGLLSGSVKG
jgi:multiple sugar transport system permease protein